MTKVFISYSRKDFPFVKRLAADLKEAGVDVWYDMSNLGVGSRWRAEIETAIKTCQFVIVVLSPDSINSEWVEREFLFASNLGRQILPLMYRPCELPLNYVNINCIDVQGRNYKKSFQNILDALNQPTGHTNVLLSNTKKSSFASRNAYVFVLVGAILVALFLSFPFVDKMLAPASFPTETATLTDKLAPAPLSIEITDIKNVPMVLVPEGNFIMGSDDGGKDQRPVHTVYLDSYYIDKFEVTNALYKACEDAGVCSPPKGYGSFTRQNYYDDPGLKNYPVIYVDWGMAIRYCEWRSATLPSEAQWEKAARGNDASIYPWDGEVGCNRANYKGCVGDTSEIGFYKNGVSAYGVFDMAGNVWEWTADWYAAYPGATTDASEDYGEKFRVIRGGSYYSNFADIQTVNRWRISPMDFNDNIGFRCAKEVKP